MLPSDQPAEEWVEENSLDPAPKQAGPSAHAETTAGELPVLDKTKRRYPVVIQYGLCGYDPICERSTV